jgi:hypothetical protein
MTRRLGIILTTMVVSMLVMADGALACRCMNRLINRCGHRRACCTVRMQSNCCYSVAPACCAPSSGEMKPGEGAVKVQVQIIPPANNPAGPAQAPDTIGPLAGEKPSTPPVMKPEPTTEPQPPLKAGPIEVPAEPRVAPKPDIVPIEPLKPDAPAKPEKSAEPPVAPVKAPEPPVTPDKAPAKAPEPPLTPDKAPVKAPDAPVIPDKAPVKAPDAPLTPDKAPAKAPDAPLTPDKAPEPPKTPDKAPKAGPKDDPFGNAGNDSPSFRNWTDSSGKYQIEARFVSFQDGTVRLQKVNGRYVRIAYDLLCSVDQDFVLNHDQSLLAMQQ